MSIQSTLPPPGSYTPFPSHLLDAAMPRLKDTEWRLLCLVVRATLGWQDDKRTGQRKEQDWLTHRQLKARTGRSSEAICKALDALVRQGWIEVRDEEGNALRTPQQRRGCSGKLYFQVGAAALLKQSPQGQGDNSEAYENSPHEPGEKRGSAPIRVSMTAASPAFAHSEETVARNDENISVSETLVRKSEGKSENHVPQSEIRKAKTTKETGDKTNPDVTRFLLAYQEKFCTRSGRSEPPPIQWGRDGKRVKGLLAQYGYERLLELLDAFFQSHDAWVQQRGYALACFPVLLPSLLLHLPGKRNGKSRGETLPVVIFGPSGDSGADTLHIERASGSLFERYPDLARRVRGQSP